MLYISLATILDCHLKISIVKVIDISRNRKNISSVHYQTCLKLSNPTQHPTLDPCPSRPTRLLSIQTTAVFAPTCGMPVFGPTSKVLVVASSHQSTYASLYTVMLSVALYQGRGFQKWSVILDSISKCLEAAMDGLKQIRTFILSISIVLCRSAKCAFICLQWAPKGQCTSI